MLKRNIIIHEIYFCFCSFISTLRFHKISLLCCCKMKRNTQVSKKIISTRTCYQRNVTPLTEAEDEKNISTLLTSLFLYIFLCYRIPQFFHFQCLNVSRAIIRESRERIQLPMEILNCFVPVGRNLIFPQYDDSLSYIFHAVNNITTWK